MAGGWWLDFCLTIIDVPFSHFSGWLDYDYDDGGDGDGDGGGDDVFAYGCKPYVRFATFLRIALCLGVGVGWGVVGWY